MRLSQEAIRRMISGRSGGGGGGGSFDPSALAGYATQAWTEENYISKTFFNELFVIHKKVTTVVMDGETEISRTVTTDSIFAPNEIPSTTTETDEETGYVTTVTTEVSSIESKKGFWTNYFLSALGLNDSGGGGGITLNEPLASINDAGLAAHPSTGGQTIVWNGSAWVYGTAGGGGGGGTVTSVGMTVPTGFVVSGSPVTSSGTLGISFASGYSLPTTAKQLNWDTAYGWGNHALAGYATQTWVGQQGFALASSLNDYLPLSAGSTKPLTGSLYLSSLSKGIFAPYTVNGSAANIPIIYDNGENLWIGSTATASTHHIGRTYISAGYDGSAGNSTIYVSVPNASNNNGTNYGVLHSGNYTDWVYSKGQVDTMLTNLITNGTVNRLAYYTGQHSLGHTGNILLMPNTLNSKNAYMNGLRIWGTCYGNSASSLISGTEGLLSYGDGGPQIIFAYGSADDSQSGTLLYTDNDSCGAGASFHFLSNQSDWNVHSKRFVARSSVTIGQNTPNTSYALYTSGNAYFTNRIYFASGVYLEYNGNDGIHLVGAGFYSDSYVSALGLGDGGGGITLNEPLATINDAGLAAHPSTSGQTIVWNGSAWVYGTAGGGSGSVTSVGMTVPTGFVVSGSPVTSSGTLGISFASGYSLPTTAKQLNWDTAYGWGNHANAGYLTPTTGDARYLKLSGGVMTGLLSIATGTGLQDATGNGLLCYHPNKWSGVSSSQWGTGAVDCQGVIRSNASNLLHYRGGTSYNILDGYNSGISGSTITINGTSINSVAHIEVGSNDLTGYSGSFFFGGDNALQSGCDYVGFQAGDSNDKWQMVAIDTLKWRQNDSGGTSTSWGQWYNITDNIYIQKELSSAGWYRVADVSTHGGSIILSTSQNFYNTAPNPATFIISHGYSNISVSQYDSIVQLGGSGFLGAVRNVRLMRYGDGKVYIEIYYAVNSANTVGVELTPIGRRLHGYITPIDFTAVSSTSGLTLADSCPVMPGGVSGVGYTGSGGQQNPDFFGRNKVGFLMSNQTVNGDSTYKNWMYMDCYHETDAGGTTALGISRSNGKVFALQSDANRSSWNTLREVITTDNGTANVSLTGNVTITKYDGGFSISSPQANERFMFGASTNGYIWGSVNGSYLRFLNGNVGVGIIPSGDYKLQVNGSTKVNDLWIGNVHITYDSANGGIYISGGVAASTYVSALGTDAGGGGGGVDLETVWASMAENNSSHYIHISHIQSALSTYLSQNNYVTSSTLSSYATKTDLNSYAKLTDLSSYATQAWVRDQGYVTSMGVTSVTVSVPTGLRVNSGSSATVTSTGTFALTFTSGYSIPTTAKQSNWDTAYGWGNHASAGYASSSSVSTLQGYFTNGIANNAARLSTVNKTAWGKTYWTSGGVPTDVSGSIEAGNGGGAIEGFHSIELNSHGSLSSYGGFIDFHYNGSSADFTSRIIEEDSGLLAFRSPYTAGLLVGGYNGDYVQIGQIRIVYDYSNNALKVMHSNGGAANLYALGGISALGISGAADGTISGNLIPSANATYSIGSSGYGWKELRLSQYGVSGRITIDGDGINLVSNEGGYLSGALYMVTGRMIVGTSNDDYAGFTFATEGTSYLSSKVSIGGTNSNSDKLYVNGTVRASSYNNSSDARLKNIISCEDINIETIARAPIVRFTWKNTDDSRVHWGTLAQYWRSTEIGDIVEDGEYLAMDYAATALSGVISVARKVMTHEEQIAALKRRIGELENEIETLKAA